MEDSMRYLFNYFIKLLSGSLVISMVILGCLGFYETVYAQQPKTQEQAQPNINIKRTDVRFIGCADTIVSVSYFEYRVPTPGYTQVLERACRCYFEFEGIQTFTLGGMNDVMCTPLEQPGTPENTPETMPQNHDESL
jgi:hypothetical protein